MEVLWERVEVHFGAVRQIPENFDSEDCPLAFVERGNVGRNAFPVILVYFDLDSLHFLVEGESF